TRSRRRHHGSARSATVDGRSIHCEPSGRRRSRLLPGGGRGFGAWRAGRRRRVGRRIGRRRRRVRAWYLMERVCTSGRRRRGAAEGGPSRTVTGPAVAGQRGGHARWGGGAESTARADRGGRSGGARYGRPPPAARAREPEPATPPRDEFSALIA